MRVRCAGNGQPRRNVKAPGPCGWRGERFEVYTPPPHPELVGPGSWAVNLDRPCPRCGGRVELAAHREVAG